MPIRNVKAEAIDVNGNGMKNEDKYLEFEELPKVHTVSTRRIIVDCTHQAETEQGKGQTMMHTCITMQYNIYNKFAFINRIWGGGDLN